MRRAATRRGGAFLRGCAGDGCPSLSTSSERERLAPFVSDLDAPVFALRGAAGDDPRRAVRPLLALPGTLRRLMLDEFDGELARARGDGRRGARRGALRARARASTATTRLPSSAGLHVACEWVSNLLTKTLERPRLGAYLEQSTRYIAFERPVPGLGYRYYRDRELGPDYERAMDALFARYGEALAAFGPWLAERFPPEDGQDGRAHERAIRAKALDLARGLLPAATLSHVGIFASAQTFERLVMHLRAEELPEAQACGEQMLAALRAVAPALHDTRGPARPGRRLERVPARARRARGGCGGLARADAAGRRGCARGGPPAARRGRTNASC